jgi:hypothetical protein
MRRRQRGSFAADAKSALWNAGSGRRGARGLLFHNWPSRNLVVVKQQRPRIAPGPRCGWRSPAFRGRVHHLQASMLRRPLAGVNSRYSDYRPGAPFAASEHPSGGYAQTNPSASHGASSWSTHPQRPGAVSWQLRGRRERGAAFLFHLGNAHPDKQRPRGAAPGPCLPRSPGIRTPKTSTGFDSRLNVLGRQSDNSAVHNRTRPPLLVWWRPSAS